MRYGNLHANVIVHIHIVIVINTYKIDKATYSTQKTECRVLNFSII